MRLTHLGNDMQRACGPLSVFSTNTYPDNYSRRNAKLVGGGGHPADGCIQHPVMPTLQAMHRNTAASPRSTAAFSLLMEELNYRQESRISESLLAAGG